MILYHNFYTLEKSYATFTGQQSGAVEACWAHNPEVRGSKPRSAKFMHISDHPQSLIIVKESVLPDTEFDKFKILIKRYSV